MNLKIGYFLILTFSLFACKSDKPTNNTSKYVKDDENNPDTKRFYLLTSSVLEELDKGNLKATNRIITQLDSLIPQYPNSWNYGNAIHKINIAKGRIALNRSNKEKAMQYLLEAANIDGSPQLDSFGPNMTLAKALLDKSETEIVIEYLESCKRFWKNENGKILKWQEMIKKGLKPDFGAHLKY